MVVSAATVVVLAVCSVPAVVVTDGAGAGRGATVRLWVADPATCAAVMPAEWQVLSPAGATTAPVGATVPAAAAGAGAGGVAGVEAALSVVAAGAAVVVCVTATVVVVTVAWVVPPVVPPVVPFAASV